ncbi:hypothetical protein NBT05_12310 [Aquimarina sp. ERC-38]|uniref:hypothetical protein n=1 Tax=Aquimarina sp. ERC-38 TaxID=2949996 RepID=UPI0022450018|nr:hypothetical protein [Aquimarina sp. ERC-38]UZO79731.1 hypothetical protein NBT05_12310 [Aquimarina sp. ERC-38]
MERANSILIRFICLFLLLFSFSCISDKPTSKEIVGTWYSEDNGSFTFYNDSTFEVESVTKQILPFPEKFQFSSFKGKGLWNLHEQYGRWKLEISFKKGEDLPYGMGTNLFIQGEGILGNSRPWLLVYYIGDPDDNVQIKYSQLSKKE